jgi:hypothetical protein
LRHDTLAGHTRWTHSLGTGPLWSHRFLNDIVLRFTQTVATFRSDHADRSCPYVHQPDFLPGGVAAAAAGRFGGRQGAVSGLRS